MQKTATVLALLGLAACSRSAPTPPPPVAPVERPPVRVEVPVPELPAPPALAREFRAAWISPVWGGEWPSRPGLSVRAQQEELSNLLDRAQRVGLNAVVLHVRMAGDALYATSYAPWSVYLTGAGGRGPDPFYDPLEYAVTQAHARGLELHAWFNPFRAAPPDVRRFAPGPGHVSVEHPEWVVTYGSQRWIDPGQPRARAGVLAAIMDVVERYDIDGVHLDDYFYPYLEEAPVQTRVRSGGRSRTVTRTRTIPFPDDASWKRYGEARFETRAAWRRSNIDTFVESLYAAVKAKRPEVAVGISPFGIWRPGYPSGITGLNAYSEIFADARRWWREGWVDYLSPQLYWPVDGAQSRFTRLDAWWRGENVHDRHLWPGLYSMQETDMSPGWTRGEIVRQIDTLRSMRDGSRESNGHVHFRMAALRPAERGGIGDRLRESVYTEPALVPAMPWLGAAPPAAPRARLLPIGNGRLELGIGPAESAVPVRWWLVQVFDGERWQSRLHPTTETRLTLDSARAVAVSSISRTGVQSAPVVHMAPAR